MNYTIKSPDSLKASVKLPASKSICNRALILNALSYSPYEIRNLSDCDDTEVMVKALNSNDRDFDIKAAGTAMRFLTAFLSKVVGADSAQMADGSWEELPGNMPCVLSPDRADHGLILFTPAGQVTPHKVKTFSLFCS